MGGIGRTLRKLPVNLALAIRFRDAHDDSFAARRLMDLKPIFDGRSVAVVGNAQSIFDYTYGSEIDSHDTIIRMNHGYVREPKCQGSRTDVLCAACQLTKEEIKKLNPKYIIFTTKKRDVMKISMAISSHNLYFAPKAIWNDLYQNFDSRGPSTGITTIEILNRFFAPRQVTLFGFDWMQTKTFYKDSYYAAGHEWNTERRMIEAWLRAAPTVRRLRLEKAGNQNQAI
jgi:hypothetical protein